jgi:two-component system LytT family sensor kinase
VLDDRRADVRLREEIAFVRRYLALQQVRFGTRMRYEIQYDDTLNGAGPLVPHLILQPIVENAVEHGVAASLDGGTVWVSATATGGVVRVVVDDDGPGPSSEMPAESGGIGLASTRERLATVYGDRARLTIGPRVGAPGTRVEIEIQPAR